jgi:hypothetical protein
MATDGPATGVFSNLRVVSGTPQSIAPRVTSVARNGDSLQFSFEGGSGWNYFIQGGSDLSNFSDDLTDEVSTIFTESPAGTFTGTVDLSTKGSSYFIRFVDQDPTP